MRATLRVVMAALWLTWILAAGRPLLATTKFLSKVRPHHEDLAEGFTEKIRFFDRPVYVTPGDLEHFNAMMLASTLFFLVFFSLVIFERYWLDRLRK